MGGLRAADTAGELGAEQYAHVEAVLARPAGGAEATATAQYHAASRDHAGPQAEEDAAAEQPETRGAPHRAWCGRQARRRDADPGLGRGSVGRGGRPRDRDGGRGLARSQERKEAAAAPVEAQAQAQQKERGPWPHGACLGKAGRRRGVRSGGPTAGRGGAGRGGHGAAGSRGGVVAEVPRAVSGAQAAGAWTTSHACVDFTSGPACGINSAQFPDPLGRPLRRNPTPLEK